MPGGEGGEGDDAGESEVELDGGESPGGLELRRVRVGLSTWSASARVLLWTND